jgi:alpha-beta hydrolase superfamily lysophospholipase
MKKWLKRIGYTILVLFLLLNCTAAFHAYKFTHFYPTATSVKKPEQMGFGDKLSAMFFGIKYPKSKIVDSLTAPYEVVQLRAADSMRLEGWYLSRAQDSIVQDKGTVIMFHGHASSRSGIIKEAESFYLMGYNVLLIDFRAHGNSDGNTCTIGFTETKDVKAAYDYVVAKNEKRIILWGISMGAATIMKTINDYPDVKPQKVILEMPFGSLQDAVKGRVRMMGLPQQPISTLLTFWGGTEQGFWAFGFKPWDYAKKIDCPVLLQWGVNDKRVTEKETNKILANLASADKTLIKYENSQHESLCAKEHEKWVYSVSAFLDK